MHSYLNLLDDVMANGEPHEDRTGVGTLSVFGRQFRHRMSNGFPLLTTKRVPLRYTADELFWFLSGSTNVNDLPERMQGWWRPWADQAGSLGPIYGRQLRSSRSFRIVEPRLFDPPTEEDVKNATRGFPVTFAGAGCLGSYANRRDVPQEQEMLKNTWRDMIKRCYGKSSSSFKSYGAKGVHVSADWHLFDNFCRDAQQLPGWSLKRSFPDRYSLDKDVLCASNRYSRETCKWSSHEEQSLNTSTATPFIGTASDGVQHVFASYGEATRQFGLNQSAVHRCLNGKLHSHHGWSFQRAGQSGSQTLRVDVVDQLAKLYADMRFSPNSRRLVVSTWNTPDVEHMRLPCCHGLVIQFKVHGDDSISLHMYQRSADIFIGVPVNIASYALLLELIAYTTKRRPRDLVISFGDLHLYRNHVDAATEQLSREARPLPEVTLNDRLHGSGFDGLLSATWDDITLTGYDPHPKIKAEVAV